MFLDSPALLFSFLLAAAFFAIGKFHLVYLPHSYYRLRKWESSGRLYERLFVRQVARYLRNMRGAEPTLKFSGRRAELVRLVNASIDAETLHIWHLLAMLVLALGFYAAGNSKGSGVLILCNLPMNVYPIMVQRYNRPRFQRVADRSIAE